MHAWGCNDVLLTYAGEFRSGLRCDGHAASVRARGCVGGQRQSGRVRDGIIHREFSVVPDAQPVGPRSCPRRKQRRSRRSRRRGRVRILSRLRHRRQHSPAGVAVRCGGHEAHVWRSQPLRPGGLRQLARSDRADHQGRHRLRDGAQRHSRSRPGRLDVDRVRCAGLYGGVEKGSAGISHRSSQRVLCCGDGERSREHRA